MRPNLSYCHDRFVTQAPVTLVLKEKMFSLTGDNAAIKDVNDVPWFKNSGSLISWRERNKLQDFQGNDVATIRGRKFISFHIRPSKGIYDAKGTEIARVKKKKYFSFHKDMLVTCNDGFTFEITGSILAKKFKFVHNNGEEFCSVYRPTTLMGIVGGRDTYHVDLPKGVDAAFVISCCIAVEELTRES